MKVRVEVADRKAEMVALYKRSFPKVASDLSRRGATFEETKDLFNDAVLIMYERAVAGKPEPLSEASYLTGVARHLWYRRYRASKETALVPDPGLIAEVEAFEQPSSGKLLRLMQTAGRRCLDLLQAFYYERLGLAEIAREFGYSGVRSATVQKYKCLEKIRDHVKERGEGYEDFLE